MNPHRIHGGQDEFLSNDPSGCLAGPAKPHGVLTGVSRQAAPEGVVQPEGPPVRPPPRSRWGRRGAELPAPPAIQVLERLR